MFLPVRRSFIAQIDRVFSDHQDVLVSNGIWGSLSMLRPKDKEAIAKARRRLKKIEISIRTECLFEKPEGKSPVTSRKATSR
jgi:hypothetical protein